MNSKRDWQSWTLSVTVHAITLLALVFVLRWKAPAIGGEQVRRVSIVLSSPDEQPNLFESDTSESKQESSSTEPALNSAMPDSPPPQLVQPLTGPGSRLDPADVDTPDAGRMADAPKGFGRHEVNMALTEDERKRIAAEQAELAALAPKGPPTTINVFGSGDLTGRKFVFVLDRSQSMGTQGLGVMRPARDQLTAAINALEPHHQFQIVAYHHQTVVIDRRRLLDATAANKKMVPEFIDNLASFGGTKHLAGLNAALAFRPDVVVLMTDGGLPLLNETQLKAIARHAGSGTQIHTIQFGIGARQDDGNFMQALALQNNGTYRYIDVRNLNGN